MRIVFLTGSDKSGKTVLSKQFTTRGWEYVHFDPPKGSAYAEYRGFLEGTLRDPASWRKKFVVDRYMYCEFPYSKHFRRASDMTIDKMNELEDEILQLDPNAKVVYCENDLDINWDLLQAEGRGDFASKDEVCELRKNYRSVLRWAHIPVIEYDYTRGTTPAETYEQAAGNA